MAAEGRGIHNRGDAPPTRRGVPGPASIGGPVGWPAEERAVQPIDPVPRVELSYPRSGVAASDRGASRPMVEELLESATFPGGSAFRVQEGAGLRVHGVEPLPEPGVTERLRSHLRQRMPSRRGPAPSPGGRWTRRPRIW
jgi:hypothetical protein